MKSRVEYVAASAEEGLEAEVLEHWCRRRFVSMSDGVFDTAVAQEGEACGDESAVDATQAARGSPSVASARSPTSSREPNIVRSRELIASIPELRPQASGGWDLLKRLREVPDAVIIGRPQDFDVVELFRAVRMTANVRIILALEAAAIENLRTTRGDPNLDEIARAHLANASARARQLEAWKETVVSASRRND